MSAEARWAKAEKTTAVPAPPRIRALTLAWARYLSKPGTRGVGLARAEASRPPKRVSAKAEAKAGCLKYESVGEGAC